MTPAAGVLKQNGETNANSSLIESTYKKVTQLEHILIRPDTYIGSIEKETQSMWVFDDESEKIVQKQITFVPGLYKIFDEIIVNAADNKQRDPKMDTIKINIDRENNEISVWNNGLGLPIAIHKTEKKYVPTMIFGTLLTSSNYNDSEKKVTGGRNGYGAKLCNIFSSKFTVDTMSKSDGKSFSQSWYDNMSRSDEPAIEKLAKAKCSDFTCVTFKPDFSKFKMEYGLDNDIIGLFKRRAYDIAASCKGVKVVLNGTLLPVKTLKDYAKLYLGSNNNSAIVSNVPGGDPTLIYEKAGERWEVCFGVSDSGFNHVSFVNNIATTNGGTHVNMVADMIIKEVMGVINKKNKSKIQLKNFQVKNHMWVFVNCLIENPSFNSQTKETMTLNVSAFGSKPKFTDKFYSEITKCGFVDSVLEWIKMKDQTKLAKQMTSAKTNKLRDIPKLDDANYAGTAKSLDCTLILTEGDSAKSMAVSGLGIIGRDKYGIFPLRGKVLNVREATTSKISENAEIGNIIKILALNYKRKYNTDDDMKTLRYGKLMIMTDQDTDGSHIKGLLINMFDQFWPELLKRNFLEEFITPIIKVKKARQEIAFYAMPEFEEWKKNTADWNTWKVKYYKGLGTSTADEAKAYFGDFERHRIGFAHVDHMDNDSIQLAFSKNRIDDRKSWLTAWMDRLHENPNLVDGLYSSANIDTIRYSEFINKELILFSYADLKRSIPSILDGLKPTQRKVVFTCLKLNIIGSNKERKVSQLGGTIGSEAAYHHGEMSLVSTICNLAQNFVGSNNLNLMMPIGQFGTRLHGGSDAASPRYIFTALTTIIKHIFHPDDNLLLKYQYDDNLKVEPEAYIPVIPMILVNGAEGIGTGWSTKVPNFSPYEIIDNLRRMIGHKDPKLMHPYYKNFTGSIVAEDSTNSAYAVFGECADLGDNMVEITELPIKTWTQNYKENKLEILLHGDSKRKLTPKILDYSEYNTDTTVRFVVKMIPEEYNKCLRTNSFHKFFSLTSTMRMTNCVLFNSKGSLKTYTSAQAILDEFFNVRMDLYRARKEFLQEQLQAECKLISNQARFINEIITKKLIIERKLKKAVLKELVERKYDPNPVNAWKKSIKLDDPQNTKEAENEAAETDSADDVATFADYAYLVTMQIFSLTKEKIDELNALRDKKLKEFDVLINTTAEQIYLDDLDALEKALRELEEKERKEQLEAISKGQKLASKSKKGKAPVSKPSRKAGKTLNLETNMKLNFKDPNGIRFAPKIEEKVVKKPREPKVKAEKKPKNDASDSNSDSQSKKSSQQEVVAAAPKITNFASKLSKPAAKLGDDFDTLPESKRMKIIESDDDDILVVEQPKKAPVREEPKKAAKRPAIMIESSTEEDDNDFDDDSSDLESEDDEDISMSE